MFYVFLYMPLLIVVGVGLVGSVWVARRLFGSAALHRVRGADRREVAELRRRLDLRPHDRDVRYRLAELLHARGHHHEAYTLAAQNLDAGDDDVDTRFLAGAAAVDTGDEALVAKGRALLEGVHRDAPGHGGIAVELALGRGALAVGDAEAARAAFARAVDFRPGSVEARVRLAAVLRQLGKPEAAKTQCAAAWQEFQTCRPFERQRQRGWMWRGRPQLAVRDVLLILAPIPASAALFSVLCRAPTFGMPDLATETEGLDPSAPPPPELGEGAPPAACESIDWTKPSSQTTIAVPRRFGYAVLSADARFAAFLGPDGGWVTDLGTAETIVEFRHGASTVMTFAGKDRVATGGEDGVLKIRELPGGDVIRSSLPGPIFALDSDAEGRWLAVTALDELALWNLETLSPEARMPDPILGNVRFGAGGSTLHLRTGVGQNHFFSIPDLEQVRAFSDGHFAEFTHADLSRSGRLLATGSEDAFVHVWDTVTGERIRTFDVHSGGGPHDTHVWFDPTGRCLLCDDYETPSVWNVAGSQQLGRIELGQGQSVLAARWTDDALFLLVADDSGPHQTGALWRYGASG